jgi:hypothetical protein
MSESNTISIKFNIFDHMFNTLAQSDFFFLQNLNFVPWPTRGSNPRQVSKNSETLLYKPRDTPVILTNLMHLSCNSYNVISILFLNSMKTEPPYKLYSPVKHRWFSPYWNLYPRVPLMIVMATNVLHIPLLHCYMKVICQILSYITVAEYQILLSSNISTHMFREIMFSSYVFVPYYHIFADNAILTLWALRSY